MRKAGSDVKKRSRRSERLATEQAAAVERAARAAARAEELRAKGELLWSRFVGMPAEKSVVEFLELWTPDKFLDAWTKSVAGLGIDPANVVRFIDIHHASAGWQAENPETSVSRVSWWPNAKVRERHERVQAIVAAQERPFDLPTDFIQQGTTVGLRYTASHLLSADGDARRVGAVLICASLFTRVESSRPYYQRDAWPPVSVALTLLEWARRIQDCRWPDACTDTFPRHESDDGAVITSMDGLVNALAVEHARVLHAWAPIVIRIVGPTEPTDLERRRALRKQRS